MKQIREKIAPIFKAGTGKPLEERVEELIGAYENTINEMNITEEEIALLKVMRTLKRRYSKNGMDGLDDFNWSYIHSESIEE